LVEFRTGKNRELSGNLNHGAGNYQTRAENAFLPFAHEAIAEDRNRRCEYKLNVLNVNFKNN
jgi:hypothetical protein